jgi:diacylglycerol kinase family enzyme
MRNDMSGAADLQPAPDLRHIEIIANEHSGSVGVGAAVQAQAIARDAGFDVTAQAVAPSGLRAQLTAVIAKKPDLLIVIAGDGTANMAAALCGPDGPLLAPLPGGTMNMLPRALYGARDWKAALAAILKDGAVMPVGGGSVNGHAFHVAAILGNPALWARSREAIRDGKLGEAWTRAVYAWKRAFRSKLHYAVDAPPEGKALHGRCEGLGLICPLVSRAFDDDADSLEAAAVNPPGMWGILRLGLESMVLPFIGPMFGTVANWRQNPYVRTGPCSDGHASGRRRIHAILDGEPIRLPKYVKIHFTPVAFRALVVKADGGKPQGGGASI